MNCGTRQQRSLVSTLKQFTHRVDQIRPVIAGTIHIHRDGMIGHLV